MSKRMLTLQEIQQEELGILLYFDEFCKLNGLRYSLEGGTLLGAVRHQGFIPWDDDIDVCMPRPDYDALLAMGDKLESKYSFMTMDNSAWPQPFAKLQSSEVAVEEPGLAGVIDQHIWIDIFPMDGVPSNPEAYKRMFRRVRRMVRRVSRATYLADSGSALKIAAKRLYKVFAGSKSQLIRLKGEITETMKSCPYEQSEAIACFADDDEARVLNRSEFESFDELLFEGHRFPAMGCWDEYLTFHFGNYRQVPEQPRVSPHRMVAWRLCA